MKTSGETTRRSASRELWWQRRLGQPDFAKFLVGQSVSLVGSQFTILALPLTAALVLRANAAQMGALAALQFAPALLFGLLIGVWLDRVPRRPLLLLAQFTNMVTLATVPLASVLHVLTLDQLYVVAFVTAAASTLFYIGQTSYLPTLIDRDHLPAANARYMTARTFAQLVGPGVAGWAVQLLTAPIAIAADAFSYLVGSLTTMWISAPEPGPDRDQPRRDVFAEAREGLAYLLGEPRLRSIASTMMLANLGAFTTSAVYVLLFVGRLGVSPAEVGMIFAASSVASLGGAQLVKPVIQRWGVGWALVAATLLVSAGRVGIAVAGFTDGHVVGLVLVVAQVVGGLAVMAYNVNQQTIWQMVIPDRLMGRVQSATLVVVWAGQVAGSVLGGAVGQLVSLRAALVVGGVLTVLCVVPSLAAPVRSLKRI